MTLRARLARALLPRLRRLADRRPPDFVIGGADDPYLRRWWLIPRNRVFNVYLHQFLRSDDDRALHDHPWPNVSFLLSGSYIEHMPGTLQVRRAGDAVARRPGAAHRVELFADARLSPDGRLTFEPRPVWTLFVTGPRVREWGFHCPAGWKHWTAFTAAHDPGAVGPGCDDIPARAPAQAVRR